MPTEIEAETADRLLAIYGGEDSFYNLVHLYQIAEGEIHLERCIHTSLKWEETEMLVHGVNKTQTIGEINKMFRERYRVEITEVIKGTSSGVLLRIRKVPYLRLAGDLIERNNHA